MIPDFAMFPVLFGQDGKPRFAHWRAPRSLIPSGVVLHYTSGVRGITFERCMWYLTKENAAGVSAHFLVGRDGRVAMLAPLMSIAYHAGKWSVNRKTIGIECVRAWAEHGEWPEAQMAALVDLCAKLCRLFDITPSAIIGHRDVLPTVVCPQDLDVNAVRGEVARILEGERRC